MPDHAANEIPQAKLADVLKHVAEDMIAAEGELQALDAALGDGDLGVTVRMGFQAIREVCQKSDQTQNSDIGSLLSAAGVAFMNANASTMGTLMGTGMVASRKGCGIEDHRQPRGCGNDVPRCGGRNSAARQSSAWRQNNFGRHFPGM